MDPQPALTATPAAAINSVGWIAPTEAGRAQQLLDAHPHLVADNLELRWFLNARLLTTATAQGTALSGKSTLKAQRPAQTQAMKKAVIGMRKPLSELRGVIKKKFKEDYEAYYPQFGLVLSAGDWKLPIDHDVLVENLKTKLLPKLIEHGFDQDADTGTAVWQPLLDQLAGANTAAAGTDAARSTAKITTDPQDELIEKALRALVHLVQAQFPDNWEDVLRGWGWRKSSF
jgi:hypothetical protein